MKLQFISKLLLLIICAIILISVASTQITKHSQCTVEVHQVWTDQGTKYSTMQPWIELPEGTIGKWNIAGTITLKDGQTKAYNDWGFISPLTSKYWGFKAQDWDMASADLLGEYEGLIKT